MSSKNRIQYIDGRISNEFLETMKKKYNGRFYKKLQNTSGWSFPKEYQNNIEQEWEKYKLSNNNHIIESLNNDKNIPTESLNNDKNIQTDIIELSKNIPTESLNNDKNIKTDIIELSKNMPEFVNKETQTELFYIYDIPQFYKNQFKQYIDLVQNSRIG
jgi:hypothetical protein